MSMRMNKVNSYLSVSKMKSIDKHTFLLYCICFVSIFVNYDRILMMSYRLLKIQNQEALKSIHWILPSKTSIKNFLALLFKPPSQSEWVCLMCFFLYPHKAFNFFICLVIVLIIILIYSVSVFDQLKWARNLFQSRCTSSPTRFTSTTWSKYINVPGKLHFLFPILIKRAFLGKPALKQHHKKFRRLPQRVNSIEA